MLQWEDLKNNPYLGLLNFFIFLCKFIHRFKGIWFDFFDKWFVFANLLIWATATVLTFVFVDFFWLLFQVNLFLVLLWCRIPHKALLVWAKTNKKGIAKVTVKDKKLLKKLKKGKKYTYSATYYKNRVAGKVIIK